MKDIEECLSEDFNSIVTWLESMDLVCNMKKGKTEAMLFGTSQKVNKHSLNIVHRHKTLSTTANYKYLGVKLDQTLSLREHIDTSYKKATGRLYLLKRVRPQLTVKGAIQLYQSMILPIFTYCSILSSIYTRTFEKKISSFERRAYRTIFNHDVIDNDIGKVSIRLLQRRRLCTQVFNCLSGNVCNNLKDYFEVMSNNTRNANKLLRLPYVKLECTKKSFKFIGAKEYNSLPLKMRSAESTKIFIALFNKSFNI